MENQLGKAWGTVGGFFRVFDIAFFLPGAVVLIGVVLGRSPCWEAVRERITGAMGKQEQPGWLGTLALGLSLVVAMYVMGLTCHGVARVSRSLLRRHVRLSWFYMKLVRCFFELEWTEGSPAVEDERPTYFWNLAALCWNLAVALLAVVVLAITSTWSPWLLLLLLVVALLTMLGSEFRFYAEKMQSKPGPRGGAERVPGT